MADEIERVRAEVTELVQLPGEGAVRVVVAQNVRVCLTCGAFVPTYAAAFHMNYHRKRGDV